MNYSKKIDRNILSSKKNGWTPGWFDCDRFDSELIDSIMAFQREHSLSDDGIVGPITYRRVKTHRLFEEDFIPKKRNKRRGEKHIVYGGNKFPIKWEKVILWDDHGGLPAKEGCYYDWSKKPLRQPIQFVNHWDATLSSEACARIINKRRLSMHFLIDNDGTIYQMLDIQHVAWQAGSKLWNTNGIGVEISNAFYTRYQSWYEKRGFGPRPVITSEVNGRSVGPHLDFYPVQLDALAALWAAVADAIVIDLDVCTTKGVCEKCTSFTCKPFINHYNLTRNKIDCSSLDMQAVLKKALPLTV
ncbi:hypothetical protein CMI37_08735 [Candidatus Pacearchaeota archaeon]|nr:hypothetical protein [Candidatus Pacearchaeota archaeon]